MKTIAKVFIFGLFGYERLSWSSRKRLRNLGNLFLVVPAELDGDRRLNGKGGRSLRKIRHSGRSYFISSGPVVMQALIGGDLQAGNGATNAAVNAILSGAPIVGVAGTANRPYHRLFVQLEINHIEELRVSKLCL